MSTPRELMKGKRQDRPKVQRDTSLLGSDKPILTQPNSIATPPISDSANSSALEMAKRQNVQLEKGCNEKLVALLAKESGVTFETLIEAFIENHKEKDTPALLRTAKQRRQLRIDEGNRQRAMTIAKKQGLI